MATNLTYEERDLLSRVASGDQEAFTILYHQYQPLITRLLFPFNPPVEPSEIVQDIFYKIWLKRELMTEVRSFKSYILRMVHNRLIDRNRMFKIEAGHQRSYGAARNDSFYSGHDEILYKELHEQASKAIRQLPERQRKILELTLLNDLGREEIAQLLGVTVWVIDKDLGKATKTVKDLIAAYSKAGNS